MAGKLKISPDLSLPAEAVTETFAFLAKRGAGKTYSAAVLVEEMLKASLQVVVLDPIGAWWGLRSSADGKGPGFSIAVLGGEHADVPLEHTAGELVADLVINERIPAIIDLSQFRKAQTKQFVVDFGERLYQRNREALHLVLEEADMFAPQRPMKGEERMLGAVEDLVRRGRGRGIGISLVTQRSAVVHKDVLTQTECLVALRTTHKRDRDAIEDWIETHGEQDEKREVLSGLPALPIGTAWFWSPGWLGILKKVRIRERETFDSSATPKAGQTRRAPKTLADVDVDAVIAQMKDTIEKVKADDPKELRRQVAQLKKELASRPTEMKVEVETRVERVEVPVFKNGIVDRLDATVNKMADVGAELVAVAREVGGALSGAAQSAKAATKPRDRAVITRAPAAPRPPARAPKPRDRAVIDPSTDGGESDTHLKAGARRILETYARHHPMKLTRSQLGTLAGFKITGGTFQTYFSQLKRLGFVEEQGRESWITDAGFDYLGEAPAAPMTTDEIRERWRTVLKAGARAMLDVLIDIYPDGIARPDLADAVEMTESGGTFQTYLATLRRNGLAEIEGQTVRASDTLFMAGVAS